MSGPVNKPQQYQKWFDGFATACGEYAAFYEFANMSQAQREVLVDIEKQLIQDEGVLAAGLNEPTAPIWISARTAFVDLVPGTGGLIADSDISNPAATEAVWKEKIGAWRAVESHAVSDFCRALMKGKNVGTADPFDAEPRGRYEGPYYVANRGTFFGLDVGTIDPMFFNVVISTLFIGEIDSDNGLNGTATNPEDMEPRSYRIITNTDNPNSGEAPLILAWFCLPAITDPANDVTTYTTSHKEQQVLETNYDFHPQRIAPYVASTVGANVPMANPFVTSALGKFSTQQVAWSRPGSTWARGAGTVADLGLTNYHAAGFTTRDRPDLAYIDSVALYDAFQSILLNIGNADGNGASSKLNSIEKIILSLNGVTSPTGPGGPITSIPGTSPGAPGAIGIAAPGEPANVGKRSLGPGEVHAVDVQCHLLENIKQLASIREVKNYKNLGKISSAMPGNVVSKIRHGSALESEGGAAEDAPDNWPPVGTGPNSEVYWLQNMCPDVWALMTPHIALYRVDYLKDHEGKLRQVGEQRIPFKNFVDQTNIDEVTAGTYGRIGGAGIKSFSWSLDGVQPAEVDNMISANLVVHFQSIYDLFRHNKVPDTDDEYAAGLDEAGYLDLIIGSGTSTQTARAAGLAQGSRPDAEPNPNQGPCPSGTEIYDGANFRIKVVVGWSTPPGFSQLRIPGYSSSQLEAIGNAITASKTALHLQIVSHAINFQQDGSLELSINYQASLSGIMRSPQSDIFSGKEHSEGRYAEGLEDQLTSAEEALAQAQSRGESGSEIDVLEDDVKRILQEQISVLRKQRLHKYNLFLNNLQKESKIYGVRVPTERLLNPLRDLPPTEAWERAQEMQGTALSIEENVTGEWAAVATTSLLSKRVPPSGIGDPTKSNELEGMADNVGVFNTGNQNTTVIPFFYLGDLIDTVLGQLDHLVKEDLGQAPMQLLLGTVELIDPLQAFQIKEVKFECPGAKTISRRIADVDPLRFRQISGITDFMNIGSIPISLDKFNEWFVNTVIKPKKDSYFLLNFIKDICADLISSAYSSLCFEDMFNFNIRFDSSILRLDDGFAGKENITLDEIAQSSRRAGRKDCLAFDSARENGDIAGFLSLGFPAPPPAPTIPTILLYSVDSRPNVGDRASDMMDGIYHYFLGSRCGLAKEIEFHRQDMPGYREARITKDGSLGAQQLKELYTISMNMIGNNLHKNGTYVYVDPIAIGAGSSRAIGGIPNVARLIGLGGYFLVTKVAHEISDSGFNTSIEALQEMSAMDLTVNPESLTAIDYQGNAFGGIDTPNNASPDFHNSQHLVGEDFSALPPGDNLLGDGGSQVVGDRPPDSDPGDFSLEAGLTQAELAAIFAEGGNPYPDLPLTEGRELWQQQAELDATGGPSSEETVSMTFGNQEEADAAQRQIVEDKIAAFDDRGYENLTAGEQVMYDYYANQLATGEF